MSTHLRTERVSAILELQSIATAMAAMIRDFRLEFYETLKILSGKSSHCDVIEGRLRCGHRGSHYTRTDGLNLHFSYLSQPYVIGPADYISCLFKPDGSVYRHTNRIHLPHDESHYRVDNELIPKSCIDNATSDLYACETLFVKDTNLRPPQFRDVFYIATATRAYIQTLTPDVTITKKSHASSSSLNAVPQTVLKEEFPCHIQVASEKTYLLSFFSLEAEAVSGTLRDLLIYNHSELVVRSGGPDPAPDLPLKLEEVLNMFENLQELHEKSPQFRAIVWSSLAGFVLLAGLIFLVVSCLCCPDLLSNCCCCLCLS